MARIAIREFKGERPRTDPRLLASGEAVTALNCKLWSGALEAWSHPTNELSVGENQILWSEQVDNVAWIKANVTINADASIAPDGTTTADKLEETAVTNTHFINQTVTKPAAVEIWHGSFSALQAERTFMSIRIGDAAGNFRGVTFNIATGVFFSEQTGGTGFTIIERRIESDPNGFFRLHLIVQTNSATSVRLFAFLHDGTSNTYLGTLTEGAFVWGLQLDKSSIFMPYRRTEATAIFVPQSIYLFKDTNWFTFDGDADVVRGPIAQDISERTFFTQDIDVPRFTYDPLALTGSGPFPRDSLLLGIPPPSTVPTAVINTITGSVTNVTNLLGSGNNALASLNILSVTTDGRETHVKGTFHYDATGSFNRTTTITFEIKRGGVTIATQASQIRINGKTGEPDQVQIDQAFDITETAPAGTYTYNLSITVDWTPQTPTVENFTIAGRIVSQRVTVDIGAAHPFVAGDLITFADIIGFGVLNQETFEIKSVTATEVLIDVKSFETYSSGGTWVEDFKEEDRQDTAYVVTYVSRISSKDMEGPPSNATPIVARGPTEKVDLAALPTGEAGDLDLTVKRIYRSNVDVDGNAEFQFLVELPLGTLTYEDTTESRDLGETLPSLEWIAPLADTRGLTELHEGVFAAFSKNELLFSEPNQPHAWPDKYKLATSHPIVALGSYGTTILVTTTGRPYIVTGIHPANMNMERLEVLQSCVSKRGMVDMGYAVVYPSPDGLVFASTGRIEIITRGYFTETEWRALQPATIVAARFDERYVAFYNDGTGKGFVYDPREEDATLTMIDFGVSGMWSDPDSGDLYIIRDGYIQKWDAGTTKMQYTWKSGVITRPHTNMAFAKVDGVVTSFPVTFNLYADADPDYEDMILVHSEVVQKSSPFALTDGYIASEYQLELIGNNRITGVFVATDMDALLEII